MKTFKHFQQHQFWYEFGVMSILLTLVAVVNATTSIMDDRLDNNQPSFELWEPFLWEFSSVLLVLILLRPIIWLTNSKYSDWSNLSKTFSVYFGASLVYSLFHVVGMFALRKLVYWSQSMEYHFGGYGYRFFYEYRKDLLSFILIICIIYSYRFILNRLQGEANLVANGEDENKPKSFDRILVKKLGKEFIVKVSEVEWLESSGNYVNLHVQGRIYPTRNTLAKLVDEIAEHGFCRVHRSYGVNLDAVESISNQASGSGEVTLKSGKVLNLSRRYHDELKQRLH